MRPPGEELDCPLGHSGQRPRTELPDEQAGEYRPQDVKARDQLPSSKRNSEEPIDQVPNVADVSREDSSDRCQERHENDLAYLQEWPSLSRFRAHFISLREFDLNRREKLHALDARSRWEEDGVVVHKAHIPVLRRIEEKAVLLEGDDESVIVRDQM